MIVLGINETHCATAAVLRDGRIIGCASEERFSRLKNDAGYPRLAMDALLRGARDRARPDRPGGARGRRARRHASGMNRVLHDEAYAQEYYGVSWPSRRRALGKPLRKWGARLGPRRAVAGQVRPLPARAARHGHRAPGVAPERIVCLDHHTCHAAAAYFGSGFEGREALVLTNDNSGDGLCATASTGRGLALERHEASPSAPGSLGSFYSLVTLALGMKFGEHEYKVMGMAPYAPDSHAARGEAALRERLRPRGGPARALPLAHAGASATRSSCEPLLGLRFDAVAAGAQRLLEESLLRWSRLMHQRYGGGRLALGGGVFMNVKANMLLGRRGLGARSSSSSRPAATSRTRWARPTSATCGSARAEAWPPRRSPSGPPTSGPR